MGRRAARGHPLYWATFQAWFLLPLGLGRGWVRELVVGGASFWPWSLTVLLTLWIGYCLVRNCVLTWREPPDQTYAWRIISPLVLAGFTALTMLPDLVVGSVHALPILLVRGSFVVFLLALAARETQRRLRARRRPPTGRSEAQGLRTPCRT